MTGRRGFSCTAPYQPFAGITDPAGITCKKEDLLQHLPRVYCRHNPEYRAWFQLGVCLFLFRMPEKKISPASQDPAAWALPFPAIYPVNPVTPARLIGRRWQIFDRAAG
jgi:hypothetical protein